MKYISTYVFHPGDVITFTDGRVKTVKSVSDNRYITFTDDKKVDLSSMETLIEDIAPNDNYIPPKPKPIPPKPTNKKEDKPLGIEEGFFTYQQLFDWMESCDKTKKKFSKHFWHYTHAKNLVKILRSGYFKSRSLIEGGIPFDVRINNKISGEVQDSIRGDDTFHFVRLHLRPLNPSFFVTYNSLFQNDKDLFTIISVKREVLKDSPNYTFLYPFNAHGAYNSNWRPEYHLNSRTEPFYLNNYLYMRFELTYSKEFTDLKYIKDRQHAELLIQDKMSIKFIDKIYFSTAKGLNYFLSQIADIDDYNEIKNKCVVDGTMFTNRGYM